MTDNTKMREAFIQACNEYGHTISFSDFEMGWDACIAWQAAQAVPVVGEPVGFILIHENGGRNLTFHDNTDDLADGWSQHKLIIQPTTSITQAELDAKDARIRELEEANASLEASYRGSCMMYDATKVELKALRKDAERYRYLRKQHWSEAEICVVTNPKDAIKLGCYCPSSVRLDSAIDAAMQERQP